MRERAPRNHVASGPSHSRTVVARRRRDSLASATDRQRLPGNRAVSSLVRSVPVQRSVDDVYTLIHSLQGMANTGAASYDARVLAMIARVVTFMARGHDEATAAELRVRVQMMREQWLTDANLGEAVKAEVRRRIDPALVVVRGAPQPQAADVAPVTTPASRPLGAPFDPGHSAPSPVSIPLNPGNRPLGAGERTSVAGPAPTTGTRMRATAAAFVPGSAALTAAPFVPGPRSPMPTQSLLPEVGTAGFETLHAASRIRVVPVKWWRSANFPNHNIELRVLADGRTWAIVHIKWRDRKGPTPSNVEMMTFKAADGSSIYGGNIWSGTAYDVLLGEALKCAGSAPATQSGDVPAHP